MGTLRVYGTKNGTEKVIFAMLAENAGCRATAKRTAAQHGYTITKVIRNGTLGTSYGWQDVTEEFLRD